MNEVYDSNSPVIDLCYRLVKERGLPLNDSRVLFLDRMTLTIGKSGDLLVRAMDEVVVNTHWRHCEFRPGEWTIWIA